MSSVPMPRDLSEEAVARLLWDAQRPDVDRFAWEQIDRVSKDGWIRMARAVRALLREKVREAADLACRSPYSNTRSIVDHVVSRVLGEEAPRG